MIARPLHPVMSWVGYRMVPVRFSARPAPERWPRGACSDAICACFQHGPRVIQSADSARKPSRRSAPPATPRSSATSAGVAPPVEKPVLVFRKSAPAGRPVPMRAAFLRDSAGDVSRITLRMAPASCAISATPRISLLHRSFIARLQQADIQHHVQFARAQAAPAPRPLRAFEMERLPPAETHDRATGTPVPASAAYAVVTHAGFTMAQAKRYCGRLGAKLRIPARAWLPVSAVCDRMAAASAWRLERACLAKARRQSACLSSISSSAVWCHGWTPFAEAAQCSSG